MKKMILLYYNNFIIVVINYIEMQDNKLILCFMIFYIILFLLPVNIIQLFNNSYKLLSNSTWFISS